MINLTVQLSNNDYKKLLITAEKAGKSVQAFLNEWIAALPEIGESHDVKELCFSSIKNQLHHSNFVLN